MTDQDSVKTPIESGKRYVIEHAGDAIEGHDKPQDAATNEQDRMAGFRLLLGKERFPEGVKLAEEPKEKNDPDQERIDRYRAEHGNFTLDHVLYAAIAQEDKALAAVKQDAGQHDLTNIAPSPKNQPSPPQSGFRFPS